MRLQCTGTMVPHQMQAELTPGDFGARATRTEGVADHVTTRTTDTMRRPSRPNARGRRASQRKDGLLGRRALAVLALVVVVLVLASAVDAVASAGRVHPGVSVGGVKIGGKMPSDAVAALKAQLPAKAAAPVKVVVGNKKWSVTTRDIGGAFDYGRLLQKSMAVGRSGGYLASARERFQAWFGGRALPAPATADPAKLTTVIGKVASAVDVPPKDAVVVVSKDGVTTRPSATGIAINQRLLTTELLGAFTADTPRTVTVRAEIARPKISDASAKSAQRIAETMISGPATVTYKSKSWALSVREIAKMIEFESAEASHSSGAKTWSLIPVIGAKEASKTIVPKVGASLGNPPKNARFVTRGGSVTLAPSKDGVGPDVGQFATSLTNVLKNPGRARTVQLLTKTTPPSLTTEAARQMGIHERLSTFTTSYGTGLQARVNNIHVLGDALDGKLIAPGATFSFNGAVGERTASKGYQEANAIVKGKLVPQLGGGICQVATTMFNTVFLSGFPVLERENHSFYISHYPKGRDATVSWGGPDLRWRNPTSHWVLVAVGYTSDSITVSIYGTDPGYHVDYTTGAFTDVVPYKTTKVSDPTLKAGANAVVDPGVDGRKVVVKRTVTQNGKVVREDSFVSKYTPKVETINVGTKGAGSKTATSTPTPKKP